MGHIEYCWIYLQADRRTVLLTQADPQSVDAMLCLILCSVLISEGGAGCVCEEHLNLVTCPRSSRERGAKRSCNFDTNFAFFRLDAHSGAAAVVRCWCIMENSPIECSSCCLEREISYSHINKIKELIASNRL